MSNVATQDGATPTTTTADSGKRPDMKIGLDFPSADGKTPSGNSWDLSYTPGSKVMEIQVQVAIGSTIPSPGGLVTTLSAQGITDMITWLAGVKNAIAQASSSSGN